MPNLTSFYLQRHSSSLSPSFTATKPQRKLLLFCFPKSKQSPLPPSSMPRPNLITTTKIHIMALDGVVNVNSLFTLGIFLGLAWNPAVDPGTTLVRDASCTASISIVEGLITFHVYSFSSFLFSSLIALAVKQTVKMADKKEDEVGGPAGLSLAHVNLVALRLGTLVSGIGSVMGCGFLTMALVNLVQIKLGTLGCGSLHSFAAIGPLVTLVPLATVIYVSLVVYAFTR